MRPFTYNIYPLWLCLLLLLSACMQEDLQSVPNEGEGVLKLGSPTVIAELSSSTQTKATASLPEGISAPDASNFQIAIYDETGTTLVKEDVNTTDSYVLPVGKYMVKVTPTTASNPVLATTTASAYFEGSTVVEIKPLQTTTASVTVYWGYSILNVTVDEELDFHLKDCSLEVTIGSETQSFSITEKKLGPLYVLGGRKTTVTFKGTNYVGSGESVSKVLLSENELPRATQYDITVNASTIEEFDIISSVTASHTYDNGTLTGTAVNLTIANDVPKELIEGWSATLKSEDGNTTYRLNSSNKGSLKDVSTVLLDVANNWPYIPQGTYTLEYAYTMNEQTSEVRTKTVTVGEPTFTISLSAYTSYDKYAGTNNNTKNVTEANNCDPATLYNAGAAWTISTDIMKNANYEKTLIIKVDEDASRTYPVTEYPYDYYYENVGSLSWAAHSLEVSFVFDEVTKTVKQTHHITGLPYTAAPPTNTGDHPWTDNTGKALISNVDWGTTYVTMSATSLAPEIYSPKFYIPSELNVSLSVRAIRNKTTLKHDHNFEVYLDSDNKAIDTGLESEETYENSDVTTNCTMTSSLCQWTVRYDYSVTAPKTYVYRFNISYRK